MNSLENKKIIIVDDEPQILQIFQDEFTQIKISCLTAADGKTALEIIQKEKPDLIISDYKMPGLDGMQLLKFLGDLGIHTPVIWITGHADQKALREAWRLGVYDFFQKPFKIETIIEQSLAALSLRPDELANRTPGFLTQLQFEKISVDFEKELFSELKEHCLARSMSISQFIVHSVKNELKAGSKK